MSKRALPHWVKRLLFFAFIVFVVDFTAKQYLGRDYFNKYVTRYTKDILNVNTTSPAQIVNWAEGFAKAKDQKQVLVLYFYSHECSLCDSGYLNIDVLAKSYKGKSVLFKGISLDNNFITMKYKLKKEIGTPSFNHYWMSPKWVSSLNTALKEKGVSAGVSAPSLIIVGLNKKITYKYIMPGQQDRLGNYVEEALIAPKPLSY